MKLPFSWLLLSLASLAGCGESAAEDVQDVCASGMTCSEVGAAERKTVVTARAEGAPVELVELVALSDTPMCTQRADVGLVCSLDQGAAVTLLAPERAGYRFTHWEGHPRCSGESHELVLHDLVEPTPEPVQCVARYVRRVRVEGVLEGATDGTEVLAQAEAPFARCRGAVCEVEPGQAVVLLAPERAGLRFAGFDGPGCTASGDGTATVTAGEADVRCVARYVAGFVVEGSARGLPASAAGVQASSDAPGARCDGGSCVLAPGATIVLQAPEVAGFRFRGWSGDAPCSGTDPTLRLPGVTASLHCLAEYVVRFPVTGRADGAPAEIVVASDPEAHCREGTCEVDQGASATLTAGSAPGFRLRGWSGAGCEAAGGDLATVRDVQGPVECVAHYVQGVAVSGTVTHAVGSVVASSTTPGAVCEAGRCAIDVGGQATLTAPTLPGRTFLGWSGGFGCIGTSPTLVFPSVTSSTSCNADFAPLRRVEGAVVPVAAGSVVASATAPTVRCAGASCEFEGTADVVLRVSGLPGYRFAGWSGGPACTGTSAQLTLPAVSADTRCTANFILRVPITSDVTPPGSGTVRASSLSAAQACAQGACTVDAGSEVLLVPVPSAGHRFVAWRGCASTTASLLVLAGVTAPAQCTAVFERIAFTVTGSAGAGGGGTVSLRMGEVACAGTSCKVPEGGSVTLTAQPAPGYVFTGWNGCAASKAITITLPTVIGNRNCVANFVKGA